jgi:hypothetical protein
VIAIERERILQTAIRAARACIERLAALGFNMSASDASEAFSVPCDKWLLLSRERKLTPTGGKENDIIQANYAELINSLPRADAGSPTKPAITDTGQRRKLSGPFSLPAKTGGEGKRRIAEAYRGGGLSQAQRLATW